MTNSITVEFAPYALIVRGPIPLDAMEGLASMASAHGFDVVDPGACRPLGATLVITSRERSADLHAAIRDQAHGQVGGGPFEEWLAGPDTGISSLTMAEIFCGRRTLTSYRDTPVDPSDFGRCLKLLEAVPEWRDTPVDPSDFGRCLKLLEAVPEWRARLGEVAEALPAWAPLIDAWDELEALYREEEPTGDAPRTFERIQELLAP